MPVRSTGKKGTDQSRDGESDDQRASFVLDAAAPVGRFFGQWCDQIRLFIEAVEGERDIYGPRVKFTL